MISWSALLLLLPLVSASPLERRTTTACGQWDTIPSGPYNLLLDQWGKSDATSGWQCSSLESVDGDTVAWSTTWQWAGGTSIKSFSNMQLNTGINQQLSAISTMPSKWSWSQDNAGTVVTDVAYDLFTAYSPGGSNVNEVMVWLGSYNARPICYNYDYSGQATPITTSLSIAGHTWELYRGSNGYNEVYSFLPVSGNIKSFSGDIYEFFTHLIDGGYVSSSEYLVTAQAGTEATSGAATFKTSAYSLSIN